MSDRFTSQYTGSQVESAIGKALPLDDFALSTDTVINGKTYHVLWKVAPTANNTVNGIAIHPETGKMYNIISTNGVISISNYLTSDDHISETDIETLLGL